MPTRSPLTRVRDEAEYWGFQGYMRSLKALVDVSGWFDWVFPVAHVVSYGSAIGVMIGGALVDRARHPLSTYRDFRATVPALPPSQ